MRHNLSKQLIEPSAPVACGGVPATCGSLSVPASAIAPSARRVPPLARSYPSLRETPSIWTVPSNGYPQGEKRNASRSRRSIKSAVKSLACNQAFAESSSYFANSPTPSRLLSRLNTSSICHLPRYSPSTANAGTVRGFNEVSTTTYSANSSVWACTLAPCSLRNASLACSVAAALLRTACNHTAQVRSWYLNCTFQVPGTCWCKPRSALNR